MKERYLEATSGWANMISEVTQNDEDRIMEHYIFILINIFITLKNQTITFQSDLIKF